jgi:hypothetical protein
MGIEAARLEEWDLSIRYFREAQQLAPDNLQVLYNLGVAHDAAGRDLMASYWLNIYLASAPESPRTRKIERQIRLHEARVEAAALMLLDGALAVMESGPTIPRIKGEIAATQAMIRDMSRAMDTAASIPAPERWRVLREIATARAHEGEFDGGRAVAKQIQDGPWKATTHKEIGGIEKGQEAFWEGLLLERQLGYFDEREWLVNVVDSLPQDLKVPTRDYLRMVIQTVEEKRAKQEKAIELVLGAKRMIESLGPLRMVRRFRAKRKANPDLWDGCGGWYDLSQEAVDLRLVKEEGKGEKGEGVELRGPEGTVLLISERPTIGASDIVGLQVRKDPTYGSYAVILRFKEQGWEEIKRLTKKLIGEKLALVKYNEVVVISVLREPFDREVMVSGQLEPRLIRRLIGGLPCASNPAGVSSDLPSRQKPKS